MYIQTWPWDVCWVVRTVFVAERVTRDLRGLRVALAPRWDKYDLLMALRKSRTAPGALARPAIRNQRSRKKHERQADICCSVRKEKGTRRYFKSIYGKPFKKIGLRRARFIWYIIFKNVIYWYLFIYSSMIRDEPISLRLFLTSILYMLYICMYGTPNIAF